MGLELTEPDADRLARVLEAHGEMITTHSVLLAKLEASVEREAAVLERMLDQWNSIERRIDALEQRSAKSDGWRSAMMAAAGGGTVLGGGRLIEIIFGG